MNPPMGDLPPPYPGNEKAPLLGQPIAVPVNPQPMVTN